jgi:hypothetical protein
MTIETLIVGIFILVPILLLWAFIFGMLIEKLLMRKKAR